MTLPKNIRRSLISRFMTFEPIGLITFAAMAGGIFAFLSLTGEVVDGDTHAFDERILLSLRQATDLALPVAPIWVTHAVDDITALGGITVLSLMTILGVVYLLLARQKAIALFLFLSVSGGWLVSSALKLGVARPRPDIVPHLVDVSDMSFPSGHAMLSAVTYLTLAAILSRAEQYRSTRIFLMAAGIFLTLIIGLSRIYLGVHYPTDVMGGWCAGAVWAAGCWMIARRFISREQRPLSPQVEVPATGSAQLKD